jgi:transitional endoplasmic reticulum ATPase
VSAPSDQRSIARRVAEAHGRDVGRGIVRLDPADLIELGISIGSFVRVTGERSTICKAMPAFKEHRGRGEAQLDGVVRENAKLGIDGEARIEPADPPSAEVVTLAPRTSAIDERDLSYIGSLLDGLPVRTGDAVRASLFGSRSASFEVRKCQPGPEAVIRPTTELVIAREQAQDATPAAPAYEDIGGLGRQLARIREMIELPLRAPQVFERLGIDPPKGVLLHGPPGTGKTLIARTIAHEADAEFFTVSGPEIVHKHYGESEKHLREIWREAAKRAPSIIFLDEIDSIAPKREHVEGEVEKRIVAQLLALMDGLSPRANVVVIAATNLPNNIDPALRRPGRFDREIEIPIPDRDGRRQILDVHSRGMPLAEDVDLDEIARATHGCVGADLEALCREAAMATLRAVIRDVDVRTQSIPYEVIAGLQVTMAQFRDAMAEVEPSAIREVFVETPRVAWDDIGGLEDVKRRLVEAIEWPLEHAEVFRAAGVRPPKGVLLAGAPGLGKTLLAKAAATETEANFISIKGPELMSRYVGESEARLREVFRKARQASPCLVFFDEIDSLLPRRGLGADDVVGERVLAQFLAEMDGVEELSGVLVLGATNRRDLLDPAMLRPGRFDEIIDLVPPDAEARAAIFRAHLRDRLIEDNVNIRELASISSGLTGAQIAEAVRRAAMLAVRRVVAGEAPEPRLSSSDLRGAIEAQTDDHREEAA